MINTLNCKNCGEVEFHLKKTTLHLTAYCDKCKAYIKHMPQSKFSEKTLYFGKYAGTKISDMWDEEQLSYLKWLKEQSFVKQDLHIAIMQHLFNANQL